MLGVHDVLGKDEDMDMETIMDNQEIVTTTVNMSTNYVNVLSHWKKSLNFTNNIPTSTQWRNKKRLRKLSWNINQRRFLKQLCLLLTVPGNETLDGISIVVDPLMLMENLAIISELMLTNIKSTWCHAHVIGGKGNAAFNHNGEIKHVNDVFYVLIVIKIYCLLEP